MAEMCCFWAFYKTMKVTGTPRRVVIFCGGLCFAGFTANSCNDSTLPNCAMHDLLMENITSAGCFKQPFL